MPFEFATAARIVFGEGAVREVAPAAAAMGRRALVVTGANPHRRLAPANRQPGNGGRELAYRFLPWRASHQSTLIRKGAGVRPHGGLRTGDRHRRRERARRWQGTLGAPRQHRRRTRLPGSSGTRWATGARRSAPADRHTDHRGNRFRASPAMPCWRPRRRDRVKASLRSAYMLPRLAVVDPEFNLGPARRHGGGVHYRARRADAVDRTVWSRCARTP